MSVLDKPDNWNLTRRNVDGKVLPGSNLGSSKQLGVATAARRLIGQEGEKALQVLWEIASDKARAARDRAHCASELLNRGFGKPIDVVAQLNASVKEVGIAENIADDLLESMLRGLTGRSTTSSGSRLAAGPQGVQTGVVPAFPPGNPVQTGALPAAHLVIDSHSSSPDAASQQGESAGGGVGPGFTFDSRGARDPTFSNPDLDIDSLRQEAPGDPDFKNSGEETDDPDDFSGYSPRKKRNYPPVKPDDVRRGPHPRPKLADLEHNARVTAANTYLKAEIAVRKGLGPDDPAQYVFQVPESIEGGVEVQAVEPQNVGEPAETRADAPELDKQTETN